MRRGGVGLGLVLGLGLGPGLGGGRQRREPPEHLSAAHSAGGHAKAAVNNDSADGTEGAAAAGHDSATAEHAEALKVLVAGARRGLAAGANPELANAAFTALVTMSQPGPGAEAVVGTAGALPLLVEATGHRDADLAHLACCALSYLAAPANVFAGPYDAARDRRVAAILAAGGAPVLLRALGRGGDEEVMQHAGNALFNCSNMAKGVASDAIIAAAGLGPLVAASRHPSSAVHLPAICCLAMMTQHLPSIDAEGAAGRCAAIAAAPDAVAALIQACSSRDPMISRCALMAVPRLARHSATAAEALEPLEAVAAASGHFSKPSQARRRGRRRRRRRRRGRRRRMRRRGRRGCARAAAPARPPAGRSRSAPAA